MSTAIVLITNLTTLKAIKSPSEGSSRQFWGFPLVVVCRSQLDPLVRSDWFGKMLYLTKSLFSTICPKGPLRLSWVSFSFQISQRKTLCLTTLDKRKIAGNYGAHWRWLVRVEDTSISCHPRQIRNHGPPAGKLTSIAKWPRQRASCLPPLPPKRLSCTEIS